MTLPGITFKIDRDREVEAFDDFLNNEKFTRDRSLVLRTYPELALHLAQRGTASKEEAIRAFVDEAYRKYSSTLDTVIAEGNEQLAAHGNEIVEKLTELTEYVWPPEHAGYTILPTLLPFSLFLDHTILYSVTKRVKGEELKKEDENEALLPVFAHGAARLMLQDIVDEGTKRGDLDAYDWVTVHFLKDVFAPVLMKQPVLSGALTLWGYVGDAYLRHVFVRDGGSAENIVLYYEKRFDELRRAGVAFIKIIRIVLGEIQGIERTLLERQRSWNSRGPAAIVTDPDMLREYEEPIVLREGVDSLSALYT